MQTETKAPPRERPILFNGPMVRAILEGRKTQTRRPVVPGPGQKDWLSPATIDKVRRFAQTGDWWTMAVGEPGPQTSLGGDPGHIGSVKCPFGQAGDRLWVREKHAFVTCDKDKPGAFYGPDRNIHSDYGDWFYTNYAADPGDITWEPPNFRPSIHMPRWACRLVLEVVSVRVERLKDVTDADAQAEGVTFDGSYWRGAPHHIKGTPKCMLTPRDAFADLWRHVYGAESWLLNPWVWVIEFKVLGAGDPTPADTSGGSTACG